MVIIILCIFILSIIPGLSHGFNYEEHKYISDNAFIVSLTLAEKKGFINETEAAKLAACFAIDADMNYGRLSGIVDDVMDPSLYIKLYGLYIDKNDALDCVKVKNHLLIKEKEGWRAARYNEPHYGGQMLTKFNEFHDLAQVHAANGNLALALALNAYAAHYLEDFFAPGHLFTPRREAKNLASLAFHNYYNRLGASMNVNLTDDLKVYLDLIRDIIPGSKAGVEEIYKNRPIMFYGDDKLMPQPRDKKPNIGQKELIIAEVSKTITNLFEAYYRRKVLKSFDSNFIEKKYDGGRGDLFYKIGAKFDDVSCESMEFPPTAIGVGIEITPYVSAPFTKGANPRWGVEADYGSYNIIRGMAEDVGWGWFRKLYMGQFLGYDYTMDMYDVRNYSHGPLYKLQFDIKNWDVGLTFYLKYKFNHENGNDFRSWPFGFRVTHDLDVLSIFIGLGDEPRFTDKKEHVLTGYVGITLRPFKTWVW